MEDLVDKLSGEFNLPKHDISQTITLFDQGNSLHFIARYRRDRTGGMESDTLREFEKRLNFLRNLQEEQSKALSYLQEKDILSKELQDAILKSTTITDVKEIMTPYKTTRKTKAAKARDKGYQPLADVIMGKKRENLDKLLQEFEGPKDEIISETLNIVAEEVVNHPDAKKKFEDHITNKPISINYDESKDKDGVYKNLENISDTAIVKQISPHQIHAMLRAQDEGIISFSFNIDYDKLLTDLERSSQYKPIKNYQSYFREGLEDGTKRLLKGRAERSVLSKLKEKADERAIEVFKENLSDLLLSPGINPQVVLGLDPGFVSGCKVAVIDSNLSLLDIATIYPNEPKSQVEESAKIIKNLIAKHKVEFIVVGNGTASHETIDFVKYTLHKHGLPKINYAVVPETGASVYSASKIAEDEFPDLSAPQRGAISIARRVIDPMSEYVKIDPKSLGIGQYQHDIDEKVLQESLDYTVDKAVNSLGISLSTASKALLEHIAGLSGKNADAIIKARNGGKIQQREDLLKVSGIGHVTYEQAVGFIKMTESDHPLDKTMVHPDHYGIAIAIIEEAGENIYTWQRLTQGHRRKNLSKIKTQKYATDDVGKEIVEDILEELITYGAEKRGYKSFVDKSKQVNSIDELKEGMILNGEISNVVDFGGFVDLGLKENGLIHVSNLANRYVSNVRAIIKIGDQVKVEVINIDIKRKRIGLRLIEVNGQTP